MPFFEAVDKRRGFGVAQHRGNVGDGEAVVENQQVADVALQVVGDLAEGGVLGYEAALKGARVQVKKSSQCFERRQAWLCHAQRRELHLAAKRQLCLHAFDERQVFGNEQVKPPTGVVLHGGFEQGLVEFHFERGALLPFGRIGACVMGR